MISPEQNARRSMLRRFDRTERERIELRRATRREGGMRPFLWAVLFLIAASGALFELWRW